MTRHERLEELSATRKRLVQTMAEARTKELADLSREVDRLRRRPRILEVIHPVHGGRTSTGRGAQVPTNWTAQVPPGML